jgi:hypothetical protein
MLKRRSSRKVTDDDLTGLGSQHVLLRRADFFIQEALPSHSLSLQGFSAPTSFFRPQVLIHLFTLPSSMTKEVKCDTVYWIENDCGEMIMAFNDLPRIFKIEL